MALSNTSLVLVCIGITTHLHFTVHFRQLPSITKLADLKRQILNIRQQCIVTSRFPVLNNTFLSHSCILVYYVGSQEFGYSSTFWFKTSPDHNWYPKVAFIGDLGSENTVSVPYLENEIHENQLDMVIHAGDIAYDLDDVSIDVKNTCESYEIIRY